MKTLIVIVPLFLALAGCEYAQTLGSGIVDRVQQKNDLALEAAIATFCGTPYSAIKRNSGRYPLLPAAIQMTCGPL